MDPITLALGGMGVQLGAGILGYFLGKGDQETADRIEREALARYGEVTEETIAKVVPDIVPPTELAKIQTDPAFKDAQLKALNSLQDIGDSGGLMLQDEAVLNKLNNNLGRQEAVARNRIQDEMATRGIGGGGTELAMLRASGQDRLQRQSEANLDIAGKAQQRALDAIMGAGQMGGQMRAQEFGEKSQAAQAQDAINRFNTGTRNNMQQWAADARLGVAGTQLSGAQRQADQKRRQGQDTRQVVAGVGQGIGQGMQYGAAYGQNSITPKPVKAAVQPSSPYAPQPRPGAMSTATTPREPYDPWGPDEPDDRDLIAWGTK